MWCMWRFVCLWKRMENRKFISRFSNARMIMPKSRTTRQDRMMNLEGNDDIVAGRFAAWMKQSALLDYQMGWIAPSQRSNTAHLLLLLKYSFLYSVTNILSIVWINWTISQWFEQPEYRNSQSTAYLSDFWSCASNFNSPLSCVFSVQCKNHLNEMQQTAAAAAE